MNQKMRAGLMLGISAYLIYVGYQLVMDSWKEKPGHYQIYIGIGIVFAIVGVVVFIQKMQEIWRLRFWNEEKDSSDIEGQEEEKTETLSQEDQEEQREGKLDEDGTGEADSDGEDSRHS